MIIVAVPTLGGAADEHSGFFKPYPLFKPDPDMKGAFIYWAPEYNPQAYSKVMITPLEVWLSPDSSYKGIQPDKLKAVTDHLRMIVIQVAQQAGISVVNDPGPGVMLWRAAITNVEAKKPRFHLAYLTPIGLGVQVYKTAAGTDYVMTQAVLEWEWLDSKTGKLLGAGLDNDLGEKHRGKKTKRTWKQVSKDLEFYAKRFAMRIKVGGQ